jgi:3-hydroxy-9,10-secoandrosta-1,3,5(10)-triene-9,17-dione monooxygenase
MSVAQTRRAPSGAELLERARSLAAALRERSAESTQLRTLPKQTIRDLQSHELFRMLQPPAFGGFACDYEDFARVVIELGRSDGSVAWVFAVMSIHNLMLAHFEPSAQADVWGEDAHTLMAASYAPTGRLVAADGGYVLNGRWSFCSGVDHSAWLQLCATVEHEADRHELLMVLAPTAECRVVDDWHVLGLCGTGSKSIHVENVFVPAHRCVKWTDLRDAATPGTRANRDALYAVPVWSLFPYTLASPAIGIAAGAVELFVEQMREHKSVRGLRVARLQSTQARLAEASALVASAELLLRAGIRATMDAVRDGQPLSRAQRAANRRNHGYCVVMAKKAVELLFASTGGRGLYDSSPLQRRYRDMQALAGHVAINWDVAGSAFGLMTLTDDLPDFLY